MVTLILSRYAGNVYCRHVLVLVLLLILPGNSPLAQTEEYQVKAAFLYKFAGYVQWPAQIFSDETSPFVFGILGADALADSLEKIVKGREVNGRPIEVRRLRQDTPVAGVHVLFVGQSSTASIESDLAEVAAGSVLTVTERPLRPSGSVINFEIVDERVRFDVSLIHAEQGKLLISSRLLQVAYKVINGQI